MFVSRADKGGATLVLNYEDVQNTIKTQLNNNNKFTRIERSAEEQLIYVRDEVRSLAMHLERQKKINSADKTLITGLTDRNNPKLAPEYQPESPYAYPLFKLHKLNETQIAQKKVPPSRLVHASKYGPLYRMEKWASPYLTTISRKFCDSEFILDTGHLIRKLQELNTNEALKNENVHLFTLDVENLYPSIDPTLALEAIDYAFEHYRQENKRCNKILHQIEL